LLLPVMVVITVALYDIGEANPIKVEEMYVMLSLIQICINPMKSIQTITISFHDGLHSLNRLTTYFALPDELKSALINRVIVVSKDSKDDKDGGVSKDDKDGKSYKLEIKKNTISAYPHSSL
jgi:ABC-type multidrug transport system fused ATPase/permease subunit